MTSPITRSSGILLAVTSLPSRFGMGDMGPAAREWIELLAGAGQTWWQMLPLGPTGPGDSPYVATSSFAGNALLISPEDLVADGLLRAGDLEGGPGFRSGVADYDGARGFREGLLKRAWGNFRGSKLRGEFDAFAKDAAWWLEDWALYAALKDRQRGASWGDWPADLKLRKKEALDAARRELAEAIDEHRFRQFLWHRQWTALRGFAAARGVKFFGDMPIFVALDSCDVWASPEIFLLDASRKPTVIAGVPPDYFAKDGQLWGNPLYDWEALRRTNYDWWVFRALHATKLFDLTRIDHFRAFQDAWHVPVGAKTAKAGQWVRGPGLPFFDALRQRLGGLPFLAEDLGLITAAVRELRDRSGLPGMRVLQFAFDGDPRNLFLPHNYDTNAAVYTGTHDNDTTAGWWAALSDDEKHPVRVYLRSDGRDIVWELIRLAWQSAAALAVVPVQDVLMLGSDARMNVPGDPKGNWRWRLASWDGLRDRLEGLRGLTEQFNRKAQKTETGKPR